MSAVVGREWWLMRDGLGRQKLPEAVVTHRSERTTHYFFLLPFFAESGFAVDSVNAMFCPT